MSAAIRAGRMTDLDALLAIEHRAFSGDRISRRSFRRFLERHSCSLLVADWGDCLVGYALVLFRRGNAAARLYSLAADASPPISGVGRLLLVAAEQEAHARGASGMRLEVRADNARAISLYERSGYRRIGHKADYYADGEAALRFLKPLDGRIDRT
ncbi:GNAT family N-acetyltransferase [Arvimicrobium flavum]|uniref:GNAT family N-acetyltransferase n=1 Tax=Arvimicrobium flavum TaxID=3393320 RepID=UPI00237BE0FA|nr:GNAT family N-acetyltransferase [Mesorhizobium shangrilense]